MAKCWMGVVSKDHVLLGVAGSFAQVCHGKKSALTRMKQGDWFVYYSPLEMFGDKKKLQAFTAIGVVRTGEVYQFEQSPDFKPFRIDIDYFNCKEVPVSELKSALAITQGNWGMRIRSGHLELSLTDMKKLCDAMQVPFDVYVDVDVDVEHKSKRIKPS